MRCCRVTADDASTTTKGRLMSRPFKRIRYGLPSLRRELQVRRSGADFGVDLGFELGKILLEHADQATGGLVELGLVLPGIDGIEDLARHARQRGRHCKAKVLVGAEFDVA